MMTPIPRLRAYEGPAILSYGFRPFFLIGSLYAGAAILAWLPQFFGELSLATTFEPLDWHVHEMLYGYLAAIVTGFLLTAIPNWTGRLPLQGRPLLPLLLLWAAGRAAVTFSSYIGWLAAAFADVAFLAAVIAAATREIAAGRNWRNLKIVVPVGLLLAGNMTFHLEAHFAGAADYGKRLGIAAMVALIVLIGGRIIPSFTRNWLARKNPGRLPASTDRLDLLLVAGTLAALILWIIAPQSWPAAAALAVAAVAQAARLARWVGWRTWRNPLVAVLHAAYAFVPLGFALLGAGAAVPSLLPASAGVHAWTVGAFGGMTLAVMTRASLGHTGRKLRASGGTLLIYGAVLVAALSRMCAAFHPSASMLLLDLSALAWAAAFFGFSLAYGPMLMQPKRAQAEQANRAP